MRENAEKCRRGSKNTIEGLLLVVYILDKSKLRDGTLD